MPVLLLSVLVTHKHKLLDLQNTGLGQTLLSMEPGLSSHNLLNFSLWGFFCKHKIKKIYGLLLS